LVIHNENMRVKKFVVTYGGYGATNYEVAKRWNKLVFKKWDYNPFENSPQIVRLSSDQWRGFVHEVIGVMKNWSPVYDSDTCDGIQWTVVIQTETCKYDIYGSNNYPDNFDNLIELIRRVNGLEKFAEGHSAS
jgi:hypothetical protein